MARSNPDPASKPTGARIDVNQAAGAVAGVQVMGASIGQMTVQRNANIRTFQTIHEHALTAEEVVQRAACMWPALSKQQGDSHPRVQDQTSSSLEVNV